MVDQLMQDTSPDKLESLARIPRRALAAAQQEDKRAQEATVRSRAARFCQRMRDAENSCRQVARRLCMAPRTLGNWKVQHRRHDLLAQPRGRPCKESSLIDRHCALELIEFEGPHVGLPTLQTALPDIPRCELRDMQLTYRGWYGRHRRTGMQQLTWAVPGAVWAIDHCDPPTPIDDCYAAVLSVRDLASGCQLAWMPVPDKTAETTRLAVEPLLVQHGLPLVLKSDNGSPFISHEWAEMLKRWQITALRSPPVTPRYNGACEAGIGSLETRTSFLAARHGRPAHWTSDDLRFARCQANQLHRREPGGLAAQQQWDTRHPISDQQRDAFTTTIQRFRAETIRKLPDQTLDLNDDQLKQYIQRKAVSQALQELGYFSVTWRSISLPLKCKKLAKIL